MDDPLLDLLRLEGLPSALESARAATDAVLRDRGLRQIPDQDVARALVAGAEASTAMASDDPAGPDDDPARDWGPGSLRVATRMLELAPLIASAPGQVLTRVHTLLARDLLAEDVLGRVRADPEVRARVLELTRLLHRPSTAPALLRAAVVHGEVATLRPFAAGNGLVARAVEHLVLIHHGVDPRAALVPQVGHRASGPGYRAALADYGSGSARGVGVWIRHCAAAVTVGAERSPIAGGSGRPAAVDPAPDG